jgi:hypothetical protein
VPRDPRSAADRMAGFLLDRYHVQSLPRSSSRSVRYQPDGFYLFTPPRADPSRPPPPAHFWDAKTGWSSAAAWPNSVASTDPRASCLFHCDVASRLNHTPLVPGRSCQTRRGSGSTDAPAHRHACQPRSFSRRAPRARPGPHRADDGGRASGWHRRSTSGCEATTPKRQLAR